MRILSLEPHSVTSITADIHTLLNTYLNWNDANTVDLCTFDRTWRGTPSKRAIRSAQPAIQAASMADAPWWMTKPRDTMWKAIKADYVPSHKSSHSACALPDGNSPAPALLATSKSKSRLLFSTINRLATGHCFDALYSTRFHPTADDTLTCLCETLARGADDQVIIFTYPRSDLDPPNPIVTISPLEEPTLSCTIPPYTGRGSPQSTHSPEPPHHILHTKEHIIFSCPLMQSHRNKHLKGITSLRDAFSSVDSAACLCEFLKDSQASILRPLPKVPHPDPP